MSAASIPATYYRQGVVPAFSFSFSRGFASLDTRVEAASSRPILTGNGQPSSPSLKERVNQSSGVGPMDAPRAPKRDWDKPAILAVLIFIVALVVTFICIA